MTTRKSDGAMPADGGGEDWFDWPLTRDALRMDAGELLDSVLETINRLNRMDSWPIVLAPPVRFGNVVVDRGRRQVSALCMWRYKTTKDKEDA